MSQDTVVVSVIKWTAVLALFALLLYAGYDYNNQYPLPSFITSSLPSGSVVNWNDQTIILPDVTHASDMWLGSQVLPGELTATDWIKDNTLPSDKFVADIGGAETIMGMTDRLSLVGGDWANAPDPVGNMELTGNIYSSDSSSEAHKLAADAGCAYVSLPNRQLNTGTFNGYANATKFEDTQYFQLVYQNDDVKIYRVLP